jgi:hypothetical protein
VRAAAAGLLDRMFTGTATDRAAAESTAVNRVVSALQTSYMSRMRAPSEAANARYDEITEHGLNPISEREAIIRVLGADAENR